MTMHSTTASPSPRFVRLAPTGLAFQPASRQLRPVGPMAGNSSLWRVCCTSLAATTTYYYLARQFVAVRLAMRAGAGPRATSLGSDAKSAKRRRSDPPDADEDEDDSVDDFKSHFDYKQESSQAPKKSRKRRKAPEVDGKSRKISSIFAPK